MKQLIEGDGRNNMQRLHLMDKTLSMKTIYDIQDNKTIDHSITYDQSISILMSR